MRTRATWSVGRYLATIAAASVALSLALVFSTTISTMCLDVGQGSSSEGGCITEYVIEPLDVRLAEWFGPVGGAILVTAVLSLIFGAGWLFQLYMDKRAGRRLERDWTTADS